MLITILNGILSITIGIFGLCIWEGIHMGGRPAEMLMPVFFGGALIICALFRFNYYRHGLYGALIFALLGIISAIVRIYQYGGIQSLAQKKPQLILAMAIVCFIQVFFSLRESKYDREKGKGSPP